jgi:hypothetical protein
MWYVFSICLPPSPLYNQKGEADVSQIDPAFVKEGVQFTPSDHSDIDKADQQNFEGFTYVSESNMKAQ